MNRNGRVVKGRLAKIFGLVALVWGIALLVPTVRADDEGDPGSAQPGRAVRLSFVDGEVHLYQGSQPVGDRAIANTPLFEGARIDTGTDGRAEIQFEDGSVVRLSPETSLTLSVLQGLSAQADRNAELVLDRGLAYFELQGDSDSNHLRILFGQASLTASGFTVLRVNTDKAPGEVAVFSGNAHLEGGSTLDLHGGESVALNASDPSNSTVAETIEPDSWDAWNSDRDQELSAAAADQTPATEDLPDSKNPAWGDLDANGNWYDVPDQGYVWSPNEASSPDWDPYDNGYWMSTPAYGSIWVSGYRWGYMPYQCGAWNFYSGFGWGWAPNGCNPWWGGYGGWSVNIGFAPPRYRYPVRPRPRNPRPMGHEPRPMPIIAVNRRSAVPPSVMPAPRDRTGTVLIAGRPVHPLRPVQQQPRVPYNHPVPVISPRHGNTPPAVNAPPARTVFQGGTPRPVFQGSGSDPRAVGAPNRPGTIYTPAPAPRPAPTYNPPPSPRPNGGFTPRPLPPPQPVPRSAPAPAPRSAPPPAAPSHPAGGGGGRPAAGPHR